MGGIGRLVLRLVGMADASSDHDDLHLRKRIGVAAGLLTVVAPVSLPIPAQGIASASCWKTSPSWRPPADSIPTTFIAWYTMA